MDTLPIKTGFTLVEIVVVLMLIVTLAVIAAPLVTSAKQKAMTEEAVHGLSALRVALKEYYFINNEYQALDGDLTAGYPEGVRAGALNGVYFQDACYGIDNANGHIFCYPNRSDNADARILSANRDDDDFIRMDRDTGDLWQSGAPSSGFKQL